MNMLIKDLINNIKLTYNLNNNFIIYIDDEIFY